MDRSTRKRGRELNAYDSTHSYADLSYSSKYRTHIPSFKSGGHTAPKKPRPPSESSSAKDDSEGHFKGKIGDFISDRYEILAESGVGTFGRVLLCHDCKRDVRVAIKVIRRIKKYVDSAKIEADLLRDVNDRDPDGRSLVVRFYEEFEWRKHLCLVFEALGPSLYEYIKRNDFQPLPLFCVQSFADQLVTSIAFLHAMKLAHTDLKPENILLVSREPFQSVSKVTFRRDGMHVLAPTSTGIKLIDFGNATYMNDHKSSIINTRQYRAPEVMLGLGWSLPSDMWSIGCILMELYTGNQLFQTRDTLEHLALMEKILGPFPDYMAFATTKYARKFFDHRGVLRYVSKASRESLRHVRRASRLEDTIHSRDNVFCDLIRRMLEYDPRKRVTAAEALNHRFFRSVRGHKAAPIPEKYDAYVAKMTYDSAPLHHYRDQHISRSKNDSHADQYGRSRVSRRSNRNDEVTPPGLDTLSRGGPKQPKYVSNSTSHYKNRTRSNSESRGRVDQGEYTHSSRSSSASPRSRIIRTSPERHVHDEFTNKTSGRTPTSYTHTAANAAAAAATALAQEQFRRNNGEVFSNKKTVGRYTSPRAKDGIKRSTGSTGKTIHEI